MEKHISFALQHCNWSEYSFRCVLNFPNAMAISFARNQICHVVHFYSLFYFQSPVHMDVYFIANEKTLFAYNGNNLLVHVCMCE